MESLSTELMILNSHINKGIAFSGGSDLIKIQQLKREKRYRY